VCSETGKSYTYAELRNTCDKLATSLRKCNLLPGDHIAIILPNIPEFLITVLAASEAGLRVRKNIILYNIDTLRTYNIKLLKYLIEHSSRMRLG